MNMIEEYGSPIQRYLDTIQSKPKKFFMAIYLKFLMSNVYDKYCNLKGIPAAGYCYEAIKKRPDYDGKFPSFRLNCYMKTSETGKKYWCVRHRADTVVGSGVCGDMSSVKDIKVTRLVNWSEGDIQYHQEDAVVQGLKSQIEKDMHSPPFLFKKGYGNLFYH